MSKLGGSEKPMDTRSKIQQLTREMQAVHNDITFEKRTTAMSTLRFPYNQYSSFYSQTNEDELLQMICTILSMQANVDIQVHPTGYSIRGRKFLEHEMCEFHVELFRVPNDSADYPGHILVEMQRRSGDCIVFQNFVMDLFCKLQKRGVVVYSHCDIVEGEGLPVTPLTLGINRPQSHKIPPSKPSSSRTDGIAERSFSSNRSEDQMSMDSTPMQSAAIKPNKIENNCQSLDDADAPITPNEKKDTSGKKRRRRRRRTTGTNNNNDNTDANNNNNNNNNNNDFNNNTTNNTGQGLFTRVNASSSASFSIGSDAQEEEIEISSSQSEKQPQQQLQQLPQQQPPQQLQHDRKISDSKEELDDEKQFDLEMESTRMFMQSLMNGYRESKRAAATYIARHSHEPGLIEQMLSVEKNLVRALGHILMHSYDPCVVRAIGYALCNILQHSEEMRAQAKQCNLKAICKRVFDRWSPEKQEVWCRTSNSNYVERVIPSKQVADRMQSCIDML